MRTLRVCIVSVFSFVLLHAAAAVAQSPDDQATIGVPQFNTVTAGPDNINLGDLNLHWSFPIIHKPGRGLPFDLAITYDASAVLAKGDPRSFGWSTKSTASSHGFVTNSMSSTQCGGTSFQKIFINNYLGWKFIDGNNVPHTFPGASSSLNNCTGVWTTSGPKAASDGSGYLLTPNGTSGSVTAPSGVIYAGASMTDTNGNYLSSGSPALLVAPLTDTLGMTVVTVTRSVRSTPPFSPDTYAYVDPNGKTQTVTVNYSPFTVQCSILAPTSVAPGPFPLVSSIVYPDGSSYSFTYEPTPGNPANVTGRLQSVTLPTGGKIEYTYTGAVGGINCADTTSIPPSPGDGQITRKSPDGTTTYLRRLISSLQYETDVTYPPDSVTGIQNQTKFSFQNIFNTSADVAPTRSFYETKRQIYQGSALIETVDTCYNGAAPDCTTTRVNLPITQTTELVTLSNGNQRENMTFRNLAGQVTEVDEFDYGTGGVGGLLRKTLTAYATLGNNILNRPSSITVQDGNGNRVAQTLYSYDEGSVTPTSGVPNHYAITGARGNVTTVSRWLNTTNSLLSTTYTYDDTGNVLSTTDAAGNTTQYSYADNFADGVNRTSNAYLTQITLPQTGKVSHVRQYSYDANTGLRTSLINENKNETDYTFDSMLRPTSIKLPADGSGSNPLTSMSYPDVNTRQVQKKITSALSSTVTAKLDGLGRTAHILQDAPGGPATTDATYDSLGRRFTVTNPYFSTSDLAYGVTQSQYDALGRLAQLTKQDGSTRSLSYGGNCVTASDEAGRQRRSCVDGLGRLIEVDEPDPGFVATVATGWVNVSGNEQSANAQITVPVPGFGFETPSLGSGASAYQYHPAGSSWTFSSNGGFDASGAIVGGAGITGNNSGFTSANPPAPEGGQVAFLQGGPANFFSQVISSFQAGVSYTVSFQAAQRGSSNAAAGQDFDVYLDTALLGTFRPAGASYTLLSTSAFTTTAGSHTLKFVGRDSAGGNADTAFIDAVSVTGTTPVPDAGTVTVTIGGTPFTYNYGGTDNANTVAAGLTSAINAGSLVKATSSANTPVVVANSGFEAPALGSGNYQYNPAGGSWTFSGATGLSANGSGFTSGNPGAPEGSQVALVQGGSGSFFSQSLSGFQADVSYTVKFSAAQRGNFTNGGEDFDVYLDTTLLGTFKPGSSNYGVLSTPAFTTTAGTHTLQFVGRNSAGGDNTAFIDAVQVVVPGGSTIILTSTARGSIGNYTLTTSSTHSANVTQPSFAASASGATMTGGLDPGNLGSGNPLATAYQYDALGNLLRVDQKGSAPNDSTQWRTRIFTYDSLSRLVTATNPESGLISYAYDANGNLTQKAMPSPNQTGAAQHTVSYCYDGLNRVTGKAYSWQNCTGGQLPSGTAVVTYSYDSGTNGIGRLTSLTDQAGSASYTYDTLGRLSTEKRTIGGITKSMSYSYNLDGSVATITYPSGAVITYAPDSAGRAVSAVDTGNSINYVKGATYGPSGALTGFVSGQNSSFGGITSTFVYTNRLQPCRIMASASGAVSPNCDASFGEVMDLRYDFHPGNGDNGNVYGIINYRDQSRNQTFTYDVLNRLTSAQNAGTDCSVTLPDGHTKFWGSSYGYDAWGNLLSKSVTKCSAENFSQAADTHNRLQGFGYDAAGNLTTGAGSSNVYDAENRISGTAGLNYYYDADGNRVGKANTAVTPPTGTFYWYMTPGIVAESDLSGNLTSEYVFFGGKRVARRDLPSGTVSYYFSDLLGSTSTITDAAGNIKSELERYPWGGELQFNNSDPNHYKFNGKERDKETGLDYFGARYYGGALGRFLTPDWSANPAPVPYANLSNPQTLNLYAFGLNNPTSNADSDGHYLLNGLEQSDFSRLLPTNGAAEAAALSFLQSNFGVIFATADDVEAEARYQDCMKEGGTRCGKDPLAGKSDAELFLVGLELFNDRVPSTVMPPCPTSGPTPQGGCVASMIGPVKSFQAEVDYVRKEVELNTCAFEGFSHDMRVGIFGGAFFTLLLQEEDAEPTSFISANTIGFVAGVDHLYRECIPQANAK